MADYYPVLARAILDLPNNNSWAREELYARARTIILEQLQNKDLPDLAPEITHEQAALEIAIRRIEAESLATQTRSSKDAYLAKILQALQSNGTRDGSLQKSDRVTINGTKTRPPPARTRLSDIGDTSKRNTTNELGAALNSLGAMLLDIAYVAAATGFIGVIYIRGAVWAAYGIIGYPMLLVVVVIVFCLLIVLPITIFRGTSPLPTIGLLLRLIHSASRRAS